MGSTCAPKTLSPEPSPTNPQTPNPSSQTLNPKPQTQLGLGELLPLKVDTDQALNGATGEYIAFVIVRIICVGLPVSRGCGV